MEEFLNGHSYVNNCIKSFLLSIALTVLTHILVDTKLTTPPSPLSFECFNSGCKMTPAPLVLYDIDSPLRPRPYAVNPSKARLCLSLKRVPFKTTWVDLLDIPTVRQDLNCPATRKFDDGSDYYTLPMLEDSNTGKVIGDSFDIANYLDEVYPNNGGTLFPKNSSGIGLDYESPAKDAVFHAPVTTNEGSEHAEYARFNWHVDMTISSSMLLYGEFIPFNPETADECKALFAKRAHMDSWKDNWVTGKMRQELIAKSRENLTSLAELFTKNEDGPFLEGKEPNYADMIVGGWLNMLSVIMPSEEWQDFRTWHGGVLARLYDALMKDYFICE